MRGALTDIEAVYDEYLRLGNVHSAAKRFGVTGETVRKHLLKAGKKLLRSKWSDYEISILTNAYSSLSGVNIQEIARALGKTHAAIACKADDLGLCSGRRDPRIFTQSHKDNIRKAQIELAKLPETIARLNSIRPRLGIDIPHPRGMLGKHHSIETRETISRKNKGKKRSTEQIMKQIKARIAKYGTLSPKIARGSWKAAWWEIGGKRFFARSKWESDYAIYLEWLKGINQIKEWEHEPETFWFEKIKRGCRSYLPDFRVSYHDGAVEFHEVKGWMDARSKTKIKRFQKYYPQFKLRVIRGDWFKSNRLGMSLAMAAFEKSKKITQEVITFPNS